MNRKLFIGLGVFAVLLAWICVTAVIDAPSRAEAASLQSAALATGTPTATQTPTPKFTYVPGTVRQMWLPIVFLDWTVLSLPTPTSTISPTATRTPTKAYVPVSGAWSGTTSRGHPMSFEVQGGNRVISFTLTTDFAAPACNVSYQLLTTIAPGPCPVSGNGFAQASSTYFVNGQFTSARSAVGTYQYTSFQVLVGIPIEPFVCTYPLTQSGTWSASVAPTPTPTPTPAIVDIVRETFEGEFPGPWVLRDTYDGFGEYWWGKRTCRPYHGSGSLNSGWVVGGGADGSLLPCGSNYPNNVRSWMIYGPFSLVGATAGDVAFSMWLNTQPGSDWLYWVASTDGIHFNGQMQSGNSNGWQRKHLNLANVPGLGNLLGKPQVWIAFVFESDDIGSYPEGAYIDYIAVRKCLSAFCPGFTMSIADDNSGGAEEKAAALTLAP